ncbi:hypothetical protein M8756_15810 [Lutimaribacter sp. EGI FJ00015]|uniref:Uncharacterized protein n=1 Tax=Lutimaribacter degradans TaxID=2945989 RepID=A0ACC5ZZ18_9RHOB|nr:hypothetical protein [Lutimaribacter sp. EGI FJ00013]MCM2563552.1 hypothetical protein [Lutimaribacter sp. EGI FJ00013]MCO0614785.1 hypothetical protein [Lutimaribacter sp. EGI FJ00015]MCO0637454.1 hypothetical protein [Lutimaribacter sp. EGI FJ00014]
MTKQNDKTNPDEDLLAIRALMDDGDARPANPAPAHGGMANEARHAETKRASAPAARNAPLPHGVASQIKARILAYRPSRRHIALAVLAVLVLLALFRPWLLVTLTLLPIILVVGVFAASGRDRFWNGVLRLYRGYHARRPARAERLRQRMDAFAMRWDAFLDRFPEGMVDALYLPDLDSLQAQQDRHAEALKRRFERLQDEMQA